MAKQQEVGNPALYNYQGVKFYHFDVSPGASYALCANPWPFITAWLRQNSPKKNPSKKFFDRAIYYAQLASDFYTTASNSKYPIKGTLAYYGMLNLVKCYLSVNKVELEKKWEHHGLSMTLGKQYEIQVSKPNQGVSIFAEFCDLLGTPVSTSQTIELKDVLSHIPELHEMAFSLEILPWSKRKFLPLEIDFLVNDAKDKLFTEIKYRKKNEARVDTTRFYKGERKKYFKNGEVRDGWMVHRSNLRKGVTQKNFPAIYKNIQREYGKFELASLLTRDGYKYYCDLRPSAFHHLSESMLLMFYLGSIARYRPTEVEALEKSKYSSLTNEALSIIPQQFLYQLTSMITQSVCVVPHIKI
jgi:hypothetical protein